MQVYLKDESTHRTGSLNHRLGRSLFLFGRVNGWILPKEPDVLTVTTAAPGVGAAVVESHQRTR